MLSAAAFRFAVLGSEEVVAKANVLNRRYWAELTAKAEERCLIKRHHPLVNIVGGYKFPDAPKIDLDPPIAKVQSPPSANLTIPDDLSIPVFLVGHSHPRLRPASIRSSKRTGITD
jgi:hypothetical protein